MKKNILVLGSGGMLGHTVYNYLSKKFEDQVFGTDRTITKDPNIFVLKAEHIDWDLDAISQKVPDIEYVINCIGALRTGEGDNMFYINSEFPKKLAKLCEKYKIKLIHVSTDAVFDPLSGTVTEKDTPNPTDDYGKSKLMGEPKRKSCITFRTSIIGLDPKNHKGLLEWVLNNKSKSISGYINQNWSGCTTLQFAQLCEDIIFNNNFSMMRELSHVFHFVPLGTLTKYELISDFLKASKIEKTLRKEKGTIINRKLQSIYSDYFPNKRYTNDIMRALEELILFESA